MKRTAIYIALVVLLLTGGTAMYGQQVAIATPEMSNDGQTLSLVTRIEAYGLDVTVDGGYRLVLAIEKGGTKILLPEVRYLSHMRGILEKRREALHPGNNAEPYETFVKVNPYGKYSTDYRVSVPYYQWMHDANIRYTLYTYGHDGMTVVANEVLCSVTKNETEQEADIDIIRLMTVYAQPDAEEDGRRTEKVRLNLSYPTGSSEVVVAQGMNSMELAGLDKLMTSGSRGKVRNVYITVYGSPDGSFEGNERLVRARAQAMERYMRSKYDLSGAEVKTSWVAEDWDGLIRAIEADQRIPSRDAVRGAIASGMGRDPDTREWLIKVVDNKRPYNYILNNIYPTLRRVEVEVDSYPLILTDAQIKGIALTNPDMLEAKEIYRAASFFEEGSAEKKRVLASAVKRYPETFAANNNMAVSLLRSGDYVGALPYLQKISGDPRAWGNVGAYYYAAGDTERAREYFSKAAAEGIAQGVENMRMIKK